MLVPIQESLKTRKVNVLFTERQLNGIYDFSELVAYVDTITPSGVEPNLDASVYALHVDDVRRIAEATMAEIVTIEDWFTTNGIDTLSVATWERIFDAISCADRLVTLFALGAADSSALTLVGDVASMITLVGRLADETGRDKIFDEDGTAEVVERSFECGMGAFWVEWAHNLAATAAWIGEADSVDVAFDASRGRGRAMVCEACGIAADSPVFELLEESFSKLSEVCREAARESGVEVVDAPTACLRNDAVVWALPALSQRKVAEATEDMRGWCYDMRVSARDALWV